jgi:Protein of unknown function (DUF3237)
MTPELVPLCSLDIEMGESLLVGDGPAGFRVVAEVGSGSVSGERLRGTLAGNSMADWLVVNGGVATVDVRGTLRTDDGALVYVTYGGRIDMSGGALTEPIFVAPRFETSDERYRWLNLVQAVGIGRLDGEHLHYDWFELRIAA